MPNYIYNPQNTPSPIPTQNIQIPQQMPQQIPQQNVQPLFPQPQGNVYNINSTLEMANVPVGAGISVALCMPENIMYIKAMQNGNPLLYPYKIVPFTQTQMQQPDEAEKSEPDLQSQLKDCCSKIQALEEKVESLSKKKGDEWKI